MMVEGGKGGGSGWGEGKRGRKEEGEDQMDGVILAKLTPDDPAVLGICICRF